MEVVANLLLTSWTVLGQMAPYLLFGFLMAGVLHVLISPEWVERHLGGRGLGPVFKASLFGVPLPLCSCGVIPVTASIRNHGASRGATTGFLLSTPQTGVDSIFATYALLGPVYAVFRPVAALVTGVLGGALVSLSERTSGEDPDTDRPKDTSCTESCCVDGTGESACARGPVHRVIRYGFVTLPGDIAKALLVGILIAGAITAFVEEDFLAAYLGGGLIAMVAMMAVGVPIYVCSTASIPIAVGFMHMGASPGAALAFLVAGPATNAASFSVVWKLLGRRTAAIYLLTVALGALGAGLLLDAVYAYLPAAAFPDATHVHESGGGLVSDVSAVVLLGVLLGSLAYPRLSARRRGHTGAAAKSGAERGSATLQVSGMTCSHCVDSVTRALREARGVTEADVDLQTGRAVVRGDGVDSQALLDAVRNLGYDASLVQL